MHNKSFTLAYGDRPDVPNVALVLTDGVADDVPRVLKYSQLLREKDVLVSILIHVKRFNKKIVLLGGEAVTTPTFQLESAGSTPSGDI